MDASNCKYLSRSYGTSGESELKQAASTASEQSHCDTASENDCCAFKMTSTKTPAFDRIWIKLVIPESAAQLKRLAQSRNLSTRDNCAAPAEM
eukprot:19557-Heterococcus_DN1.PRE.1